MTQIEGRTHRDGQASAAYWSFAEGTREEEIAALVAIRVADMNRMHGDGVVDLAGAIEAVLAA